MALNKSSAFGVSIFLLSSLLFSQDFHPLKERLIQAHRASSEVRIDGILDEPVWNREGYSDFVQSDPIDGSQPSEKTVVWVAYDSKALYVAARLLDSEPERIVSLLGRRDDRLESDWFSLSVDTYFDRLSGFYFAVNPAGSIIDATLFNDTRIDYSWDGVWDWAARIDPEGWTVEMKVPYDQLRFPKKKQYIWGIFFAREIKRKNEKNQFVWIPKEESGFVSRFARLEGIQDISPPPHIEILPYAVGQSGFKPAEEGNPFNTGKEINFNLGADVKLGLLPNLTLDATLNPDFGQVEVDPAVVNLTAYETFYEEKRPFFIEGSSIFNFARGVFARGMNFNWMNPDFFYSRRIGRYPQGYTIQPGFVDFPGRTTILGAVKLSGKVAPGWSLGFLSALTGRENAEIDFEGQRFREEVEPMTYYGVVRSQREFNEGNQGIGIISTAVLRDLQTPTLRGSLSKSAFAVAIDGWAFFGKKRTWVLNGWIGGTQVEGSREAIYRLQRAPQHYYQRPDAKHVEVDPNATSMSGWAARFSLNKQSGNLIFNAALGAISPGLETNDLGYLSRGDIINGHIGSGYQWFKPGRVFRSWNFIVATFRNYDFGGHKTHDGFFLMAHFEFLNYWKIRGMAMYLPKRWDNSLTRGGPLALALPYREIRLGAETDSRKLVVLSLNANYGKADNGSYMWGMDLSVKWKPRPNISFQAGPGYNRDFSVAQWVTRVQDQFQTQTFGERYVFGEIFQETVFASIRLNWIFTPRLSFQMYLQPFISVGKYNRFKELARARSFDFNFFGENESTIFYSSGIYTVDPDGLSPASSFTFYNPDFNFKSLRGAVVLRWEYAPGSTLYLVWTQNRKDFAYPGEFNFGRDLGRLFNASGENIFLLKLSYRWNL